MSEVNYREFSRKNNIIIHDYVNVACYSAVFRCVSKQTDTLIMYEPKIKTLNGANDIEPWLAEMKKLGFPCEYVGFGKFEEYHLDSEWHVFKIDLKHYKAKDHLASALTLLRYLYEKDICKIIDHYFTVKKIYKSIAPIEALKIANVLYGSGNGHTLHALPKKCLYKRMDVIKKLKQGPRIKTRGSTNLHEKWASKDMVKFDKDASIKQIRKKMKNNQLNVYVVGGDYNYANWIPNHKIVKTVKEADLVLFTGGEDVDPSFYNEPKNTRTYSNIHRDKEEKKVYQEARNEGKHMLGICRGAQFLCVMNGGKLVQHQQNPQYIHPIQVDGYGEIMITSTHHQAAYPYNLSRWDYRVIGYTKGISNIHLDGNDKELNPDKECEIVYYYGKKCLGIQGHPEFYDYQQAYPDSVKTLQLILKNFINDEL